MKHLRSFGNVLLLVGIFLVIGGKQELMGNQVPVRSGLEPSFGLLGYWKQITLGQQAIESGYTLLAIGATLALIGYLVEKYSSRPIPLGR